MDVQILIIGGAVFVVSALLIYLISVFGMREKTYEEVIEEQRQKNRELFGNKPSEGAGKKKEKKEKKHKRSKVEKHHTNAEESPTTGSQDEQEVAAEQVHKRLEIEIEPEIIEPDILKHEPKTGKKQGKKQGKPILHNKNEKTPVDKTLHGGHAEEKFHPKVQPMDDLALKQDRERRISEASGGDEEHATAAAAAQSQSKKKSKKNVKDVKEQQKSVPEPVVVEEVVQEASAPLLSQAEPKKNRKQKSPSSVAPVQISKDSESGRLQESIQGSQLNDSEIQALVELLLSKHSPAALEWTKKSQKGDPISILKKQLQDKEHALQEEQSRAHDSTKRIKDLQQTIKDKDRRISGAQEKIAAQGEEVHAFHSRMQSTAEQHMNDTRALQVQLEQYQQSGFDPHMLKRLQEENKQLKETAQHLQMSQGNTSGLQQQLKIVNEELNKNVQKMVTVEDANKILETKNTRFEEQIRSLEANRQGNENVLTQKMNELTKQYQRSQSQNQSLSGDLEKQRSENKRIQQETARQVSSMKESSSKQSSEQIRNLESTMKSLEHEIEEKEVTIQTTQAKLTDMEDTYSMQIKELNEDKSRLQSEVNVAKESQQGAEVSQSQDGQLQKLVEEKDQVLSSLQENMDSNVAEITKLKEDLEAQRKKNNALRERNWKAMDALQQAEKMAANALEAQSKLESKDNELKSLLAEMAKLKKQNHVS